MINTQVCAYSWSRNGNIHHMIHAREYTAQGIIRLVVFYIIALGHYFFISWFTDFLAGKTGRSEKKKKKKIQNN